MKLWFYSMKVAAKGGETPIADSRQIYESMPEALRTKFAEKGLLYVRNYHVGMDVPWQKVFNTEDPSEVEAFCKRSNIEFEWKNGEELMTRQKCQAVARYPFGRLARGSLGIIQTETPFGRQNGRFF